MNSHLGFPVARAARGWRFANVRRGGGRDEGGGGSCRFSHWKNGGPRSRAGRQHGGGRNDAPDVAHGAVRAATADAKPV